MLLSGSGKGLNTTYFTDIVHYNIRKALNIAKGTRDPGVDYFDQ